MKFVTLPIFFSLVESILLLVIVNTPTAQKIKKNKLNNILLFVSLCIVFNLGIYAQQKLTLPGVINETSTIILGAVILLVFIRFSVLNVKESKNQPDSALLMTFAITFTLFNGLIFLLCMETLPMDICGISWFALSGAILLCYRLTEIFLANRENGIPPEIRVILMLYAGAIIMFVISLLLENRAGLIFFVNVNLILMTVFSLSSRNIVFQEVEEFEKLEQYNLTKRQLEVARLMMEGLTYAEIADRLSIAENTATKHGSDIFAKTNTEDRSAFYAKFYPEHLKSRTLEMPSIKVPNSEKSA